jgi:cell division transport system permease protein
MLIKLVRTFRAGMQNFIRNGWLSVATVSVIIIALFIINIQAGMVIANQLLLDDVQDRVNISVYFKTDTDDEHIREVGENIRGIENVSAVEFISKEQALNDFRERNKDNETIQKSIDELGINPLGAALNVKSDNPDNYEAITSQIEGAEFSEYVSKVNYHKYKDIIDNLSREVRANQKVALLLGLTLSVISVLITFNSIRINMYAHRQEIEVMKLVGASNNYVRMPFVWEGIFYGLVAAFLAIPLSYVYLNYISSGEAANSILPFSNTKFIQTFLTDYFLKNIFLVIVAQFFLGIFLGVVSSLIAIRKHLKV